ncbi:hypothetical protein [Natrinema ejinorense]|uniref:Uncharacterized protein n=1 Tax=Natrinema ejinorense TaxID=373386 RepID=A0A2A5QX44_9EURY|nr:hypothetical protein [Natrinema ejinorense]PCR91385.1 hypothetical protein CP557_13145 [Natrinema ejinorense]
MTRIWTIVAVGLITVGVITMAGPTFGFSSLAADRGVQVTAVDDPNAFLGVVDNSGSTDADIGNSNDESSLYYLNDNAGEFSSASAISADVTGFNGEATSLNARVEADSGTDDYVVTVDCGSSNRKGDGTVTVDIVAADGIRVEMERTTAETISVNCRGGGNGKTGDGFDNLRVGDVDAYTSPGDDRQEFAFTPSSKLNSGNGEVRIDLNDAHPDAVDYEAPPTYYPDVTLTQGSGWVEYDDTTHEIVYHAGSQDKAGNEIRISVGDYAAYEPSGPHEVTFTRTKSGAQGNTFFSVVDTGNTPLENVDVSDVPRDSQYDDGESQTFAFTFGLEPSGSDQLAIDLTEPQNGGVDYSQIDWGGNARGITVVNGGGSAWYDSDTNEIRYQANGDSKGDRVEIRVRGYATDSSGGPYEVPVRWERTGAHESDSFVIE